MFQQVPVAFSMMADLGAEVIKIEPPGTGERGRKLMQTGEGISPYFETNNRGFKGLTLNIQTKKGLDILYKLVKDADIFAQNFRPGVAERHHFAYEDLKKINPGIIYLDSSAYGPDGPNASLPGTDAAAQAAGGIASTFGDKGSRMMTGQVPVADEAGAMVNFSGLMVGLYHKKMTGHGQKIETSLLGSMIRLMGYSMTRVLNNNREIPRGRARVVGGGSPYLTGTFDDKNGKPFTIQTVNEASWIKGTEAAGFSDKLAAVGFGKLSKAAESDEKAQQFLAMLDEIFAGDTREKWIKVFRDCGIVCAPLNTVLEASRDPDVIANKYVIEVDHPRVGKVKEVGLPWKFSGFTPKAGIAPELGEHNPEILHRIGYSDAEIDELKKEEVI
jgi:crotonobetainyl-CoA:carnitine CoA-transferase CaiB-like acyl-CoA transferase